MVATGREQYKKQGFHHQPLTKGVIVTEERMEDRGTSGVRKEEPAEEQEVVLREALLRKGCFPYHLREEQRAHPLERRNSKSPNSEVGKDFMNLWNQAETPMPGGWWERWGVVPANRAVDGSRITQGPLDQRSFISS